MSQKVNVSILAAIGILISNNASGDTQSLIEQRKIQETEAAALIADLTAAGLIQVDPESGVIKVNGSIMDILQISGWAASRKHSLENADACSRSDKCSSPTEP